MGGLRRLRAVAERGAVKPMLDRLDELLAMPVENCGNHPRSRDSICFPPLPAHGDLAHRIAAELAELGLIAYVTPTCDRGILFELPDGAPAEWRGHVGVWGIWIEDGAVHVSVNDETKADEDLIVDMSVAPQAVRPVT